MLQRTILVVGLLVLSTVASGGVVTAGGSTADLCANAPVLDEGTHSGTVTPNGYSLYRLDVGEAGFVTVRMEFDQQSFSTINIGPATYDSAEDADDYGYTAPNSAGYGGEYSTSVGQTSSGVTARLGNRRAEFERSGGTAEIWVESSPACIAVFGIAEGGTYTMSVTEGDSTPPEVVTVEEAERLQTEIDDLNDELDEREQRIDELETQLADSEERIEELETQLENADVSIDVTVEPSGERFVAGSQATVSVDALGASATDVTLSFAGTAYTPTDGSATIPLEAAGQQELSVEYGDASESVTLDVEAAETTSQATDETGAESDSDGDETNDAGETATGDDANDASETEVGDDGSGQSGSPGLGVTASLAALLAVVAGLLRR